MIYISKGESYEKVIDYSYGIMHGFMYGFYDSSL